MIIVETYNCFGDPITACIGKRKADYVGEHGLDFPQRLLTNSTADLLEEAIQFRRDPKYYDLSQGARPEDQSEWAFIFEQLAGEGTI